MLYFYIGAILLIACFLLFVLGAWRRSGKVAALQSDFEKADQLSATNVRLYRRQLADIEQQKADKQLTDAEYRNVQLELERQLLEDSQVEHPRAPLAPPSAGKWLAIAGTLVCLVAACIVYHLKGSSENVELFNVRNQVMQSAHPTIPHYIARFEELAKEQPDNPDVWAMLYPLYRDSGRYSDGVAALRHIIAISGHNPALDAELAQAEFFASGRKLTPEISQLIHKVEQEDPQQPTINSLAGFISFLQGDYAGAISHWRISLAGQQNPDDQSAIRGGIEIAQQRLQAQKNAQQATSDTSSAH